MGIAPQPDAFTRSDYLSTPAPHRGVKESYVNAPMVPTRPRWQEQAACRGVGPDAFFPERGQGVGEALAYCDRCPVVAECRAYSESLEDQMWRFGVWGGRAATQRRTARTVEILTAEGKPSTCACGKPVRYPAAGLCGRCYERQRARLEIPSTYTCAICGKAFGTLKGAHQHLAGWHWVDDRDERTRNVITRAGRPAKDDPIDAAQRRHPTGRMK